MKNNMKNSGFTLIEMIIYISVLGLILVIIMGTFFAISSSEERVFASKNIERSAMVSLDKLAREIRVSSSFNEDESIFNEDISTLSIKGPEGDVKFFVENGRLFLDKNEKVSPLSYSGANVEKFKVIPINVSYSKGVKLELTFSGEVEDGNLEQSFYSTIILRGSYE